MDILSTLIIKSNRQIAYFEDDCADELSKDLVSNSILEKDGLALQPTMSRFFNRMDEDTLIYMV